MLHLFINIDGFAACEINWNDEMIFIVLTQIESEEVRAVDVREKERTKSSKSKVRHHYNDVDDDNGHDYDDDK